MPPKRQYSPEAIIEAAFTLVRREGWSGLSARAIAREMGASTRPIYSALASMKTIEEAVVKRALALYTTYLTANYTEDPWIDSGIGYIRFAHDEGPLFRAINDAAHTPLQRKHSRIIWDQLGAALAAYPPFEGLDAGQIERIRTTRWMLLHGMATLILSGWLRMDDAHRIIMGEKPPRDLAQMIAKMSHALRIGFSDPGTEPPPADPPPA
ncbi:MAG: TetR-like C-terminal domain-containing protein [Desulfosarcinaceae bacterium]|nr:TetR-like C-terminal domain-containing protein [Desulfosarcinaceae bacterium]